jgi:hypothetical protein
MTIRRLEDAMEGNDDLLSDVNFDQVSIMPVSCVN